MKKLLNLAHNKFLRSDTIIEFARQPSLYAKQVVAIISIQDFLLKDWQLKLAENKYSALLLSKNYFLCEEAQLKILTSGTYIYCENWIFYNVSESIILNLVQNPCVTENTVKKLIKVIYNKIDCPDGYGLSDSDKFFVHDTLLKCAYCLTCRNDLDDELMNEAKKLCKYVQNKKIK